MILPEDLPTARQVLVMDEASLLSFLDRFYDKVASAKNLEPEWLSSKEAKKLLGIKSDSTLISYKNQGFIAFSELGSRHHLYSRTSILQFISSRANKTI